MILICDIRVVDVRVLYLESTPLVLLHLRQDVMIVLVSVATDTLRDTLFSSRFVAFFHAHQCFVQEVISIFFLVGFGEQGFNVTLAVEPVMERFFVLQCPVLAEIYDTLPILFPE